MKERGKSRAGRADGRRRRSKEKNNNSSIAQHRTDLLSIFVVESKYKQKCFAGKQRHHHHHALGMFSGAVYVIKEKIVCVMATGIPA